MLAPPSASTINIRRHSSHNCHAGAKGSPMRTNAAAVASNGDPLTSNNPTPPPVPKRTFLGKIIAPRSFSESPSVKTASSNAYQSSVDESRRRNTKQPAHHQSRRTNTDQPYPTDQYSDDDRLSIESVFEDPKSSDPIIFSKSNRSSSDSNKSHGTIDTGYMSSSNDNDRIFFGPSEDFRTRFSSVDTQSSLDSCVSSDSQSQVFSQSQSRCIISPLAAKRDEYDDHRCGNPSKYGGRSNISSGQPKMSTSIKVGMGCNGSTNDSAGRRIPSVPNRMQATSMITSNGVQQRPRPPPPPPIRPHNSLDSGKIFHHGTMLGAFQNGIAKITNAATITSEAVIGRKITNAAKQISLGQSSTQPPKLNHRQDSTLSSDSFSMTSSPGYNTKNMEAPLLQHASRINRNNCLATNESVDSFGMTSRYVHGHGRTMRQDSNVSSDSFSQTSSPGYNTKMIEQPLLAHAVKFNASKLFRLLNIDMNTEYKQTENDVRVLSQI